MPERTVITSLSGAVAPLVTVSTAQASEIDKNSVYVPRDWRKSTPFVKDEVRIDTLGVPVFNGENNFEFAKQAHFIQDICLRSQFPPQIIAPAGSPGHYVDHVGYAMIDYFDIVFGSNQLYRRQALDLYFKYRKALETEKRDAVNDLIEGDKTIAQRNQSLLNGMDNYTDMFLPFELHTTQAFPLMSVSQKVRMTLKTKALQNLIQLPVAGTTITQNGNLNFSLIARVVHVTGKEADLVLDFTRDNEGISYLIHQNVRQNQDDIMSLTNGFIANIKLSSITKPIRFLQWALIPTKLQNDTGRNDYFFFQPQPNPGPVPPGMTPYNFVQSWAMEANGQIIQRSVPRKYTVIRDHAMMNPAPHGDEIFTQYYDNYPHSVNATIGYMDYTNLNNVVLQITFGTGGTGTDPDVPANAQALRLVVNAEDDNFWFFHSGNVSRAFN